MHPYRTHTCNELRAADAGKTARLSGWVFRKRDHGGILFIDLRDHYGLTQVVVHPSRSFFGDIEKIKLESVVTFTGEVVLREPSTVNPELPTGDDPALYPGRDRPGRGYAPDLPLPRPPP